MMSVSRRRLFRYLAVSATGGTAAAAAEAASVLDSLRNVSAAHGLKLSDERLRVIRPVIEQRLSQLRALRELEIDDTVAPTPGILDR
jgi:hypothetical protein